MRVRSLSLRLAPAALSVARFLLPALLVAALPAQEFVRVSPRDHRYLELSNGRPYIPNGLNMIAAKDMATFEEWLSALAANRGNYIRVWLSSPFWDVEHEKSGVYDEAKAARIDHLLELCRRNRIYVKLTMEHLRSIGGGRQAWADKPLHNVAQGGPARDIADFFNGRASRQQFLRKIEWYRQRYGDQSIIYGWELWNEVNAVNRAMQPDGPDVMDWTATMLAALHQAFPRNMALQSLGSFDNDNVRALYERHSRLGGNDLAQVHRYLDLGAKLAVCHGPVDVLAADAVRELLAFHPGKPVILAESGAVEPNHSGPSKLYAGDRDGLILHDVLFAPFFAGAAGAGQIWHWDSYVAANKLWHHFDRFAQVVEGLDPASEDFQPSMLPHDQARVYVLRGRRTTLYWLRAVNPDARLSNVSLPASKGNARAFDPWANRWTVLKSRGGRLGLPEFSKSLVVVMK